MTSIQTGGTTITRSIYRRNHQKERNSIKCELYLGIWSQLRENKSKWLNSHKLKYYSVHLCVSRLNWLAFPCHLRCIFKSECFYDGEVHVSEVSWNLDNSWNFILSAYLTTVQVWQIVISIVSFLHLNEGNCVVLEFVVVFFLLSWMRTRNKDVGYNGISKCKSMYSQIGIHIVRLPSSHWPLCTQLHQVQAF